MAMNIGPMDIFWVFLILTSLQPVVKQRWLEASRHALIARLERKRRSRMILLAHRQETMSFLGFPVLSKGKWTHDFPITFDYAKELGLHVRSDMPSEILDLMALYPQPVRGLPTVEYLPGRHVAEGARSETAWQA